MHTSPQLVVQSAFFTLTVAKHPRHHLLAENDGNGGGNALSTMVQHCIDSGENDEVPSSLHSILDDDAHSLHS